MDNDNDGCCGCLVTVVVAFLVIFLLNYWGQIDARLAQLLGLQ